MTCVALVGSSKYRSLVKVRRKIAELPAGSIVLTGDVSRLNQYIQLLVKRRGDLTLEPIPANLKPEMKGGEKVRLTNQANDALLKRCQELKGVLGIFCAEEGDGAIRMVTKAIFKDIPFCKIFDDEQGAEDLDQLLASPVAPTPAPAKTINASDFVERIRMRHQHEAPAAK